MKLSRIAFTLPLSLDKGYAYTDKQRRRVTNTGGKYMCKGYLDVRGINKDKRGHNEVHANSRYSDISMQRE